MSIVFGHNNFVIKRVDPKELGLEDNPQLKNAEIQLIQRYAHLYFIPVFPIGRDWIIRRDGISYEATRQMQIILHNKYPFRVHIGAFALPLLAILGVFIFMIYEKVSRYQGEIRYANELEKKGTLLTKKLDSIGNDNSSIIAFYDEMSSKSFVYSVLKRNGDKFLLGKLAGDAYDDRKREVPYSIGYYFMSKNNEGISDSIWITKNDIKKSINFKDPFKPVAIKGLGNSLEMSEIYIISDAYFAEDTPEDAKTEMYREFVNYGKNAVLDSIVPVYKTEDWKLSKTKVVNFNEKFALKTESNNSAFLYYHTTPDNKKHKVRISDHHIENNADKTDGFY